MPTVDIFSEFAVILAVAAAAGGIGLLLRQPLIVAFIAVGITLGPSGVGWVTAADQLDLLAKLGITLLLFVVGLRLDVHLIRTMGPVALATGLGQVAFTAAFGYLIALAFGFSHIASVYLAVALTFSSTIIIVKLLSDKREIDSLHGRIAVGLLIVQDIVVVITIIALSAAGGDTAGGPLWQQMAGVLLKGIAFVAAIAALMRYVLNGLVHRLARQPELLILFAIAWAASLAAIGELLGFSKEVGAFVGGVSLASTAMRDMIAARLVGLRDFLLLFFFIDLGAQLDLGLLGAEMTAAIAFSAFVLIGNPLIVVGIMGYMGYRPRTGFLAGLTVAQVSEFSLIMVALGRDLGHVGQDVVGLTTLVALITISASTYMILYSQRLYEWLAPYLQVFERRSVRDPEASLSGPDRDGAYEVIVFGIGRFGSRAIHELRELNVPVLAVDFDPETVRRLRSRGGHARFGDASDPEFIATLPLATVRWVVTTVRETSAAGPLVSALRDNGYRGRIAAVVHNEREADAFTASGVDVLLRPYQDAARDFVLRLAVPAAAEEPAGRARSAES